MQNRPDNTATKSREASLKEFERFENSLEELKETLQDLKQDLQHARKIGDSFLATDVNFFLNNDGYPGDASECYLYLAEIRRKFHYIGQLCVFLDSLEARCDDMVETCDTARMRVSGDNDPGFICRFASVSPNTSSL